MPDKLFTIALPVRNGGAYLRQCVESILAQRCGDFDLDILDNASTDGTAEWLATLRDARVRVHPAARPLSIQENWARIKDLPKNEYLTTIGHDDLLDPGFLEVISGLIRQHPDAGLYLTHFRLIDGEGKFLRHCRPMPARETAEEFLGVRLCELRDSFGTGHVLRSAAYDAIGGIPPYPKLLFADDALFMQAIGGSYRATALDEAFSYRWHAASESASCTMGELFASLEQYGCLLAGQSGRDPALAEVLRRYFPRYAARIGWHWRREALLAAYHARTLLDPGVDRRVHTLASLFGEIPALPPLPGAVSARLLEGATRSIFIRALYAMWRAQQKSRETASRWLSRGRSVTVGGNPARVLRAP